MGSRSNRPRIEAACVRSPDRFAFALFDGTVGEEPFTALITYDGTQPQPWSRYDIPRFVAAIGVVGSSSPLDLEGADYAVLSENGDLYFVGNGVENGIVHEAIPFLPDHDDDPPRYGTLIPSSTIGAVVAGDQVMIRSDRDWRANMPDWNGEAAYYPPTWNAFVGSAGDILLAGERRPSLQSIWVRPGDPQWRENMPYEEKYTIQQQRRRALAEKEPEYQLHLWHEGKWNKLSLALRSLPIASHADDGGMWLVGANGLILERNDVNRFRDRSFKGDREKFLIGITRHEDQLVIASDRALFQFNGHILEPFEPKVRVTSEPYALSPSHVESVDGVLMLFDYNQRIHRFVDSEWSEVSIPPELLERDFTGLQ